MLFQFQLRMTQVFTYVRWLIGILQYLMPFITISAFFPYHASSPYCNVIPGFINIDYILSIASTFIFYIILIPVIYTVIIVLVPGVPQNAIDIPYIGTIFNDNNIMFTNREHQIFKWNALSKATSYYSALSSPDVWWFSVIANDVNDLSAHATTILNPKDNHNEDKDDDDTRDAAENDYDNENKCSSEIDNSSIDKKNTSMSVDNGKSSYYDKTTSINNIMNNVIGLCSDNVTTDEHSKFNTITSTQSPSTILSASGYIVTS